MAKQSSSKNHTARKRRGRLHSISAKWRKLFKLIPNYDPIKTAGRDCVWDESKAELAIDWFPMCMTHVEGALAGKPFIIEPWQQAWIGCLFGWLRHHDLHGLVRRFREVLLFIARKNGKTPLVAGICNFVLFCDGEIGAQIYSAAGEREQAALMYRHARGMVEAEPELAKRAKIYGGQGHRSIHYPAENSVYKILSSDADTKHGFNLHLGIIDELHVQKNAELVDVMRTAMASLNRKQPLLIYVTTSDFDRPKSVCNEVHDYASKIASGIIKNDSFLPVIFEADKEDDWTDEAVWKKANPNLGVSVSIDFLRSECAKAKEILRLQNPFKRMHLNLRTEQDTSWLDILLWDKCCGFKRVRCGNRQRKLETPMQWRERMMMELTGHDCFIGLDLSSKIDMTAVVLIFKPDDESPKEPWIIIPHFWVPEDRVAHIESRDIYEPWVAEGFITASPGNEIDLQAIRKWLNEMAEQFEVREVGYDDWNATELSRQLRDLDGFVMHPVRQGSRSLSDPMKELEAMIASGRLHHGGNPVMRWMVQNISVKEDENGNIQPNKKKSTGKIDGVVATITGMARALAVGEEPESVYETRGVLSV